MNVILYKIFFTAKRNPHTGQLTFSIPSAGFDFSKKARQYTVNKSVVQLEPIPASIGCKIFTGFELTVLAHRAKFTYLEGQS